MFDETPEIMDQLPPPRTENTDNPYQTDPKFPHQHEVNVNVNMGDEVDNTLPGPDFGDSLDTVPINNEKREHTEVDSQPERNIIDHTNVQPVQEQLRELKTSLTYIFRTIENDRRGLVEQESLGGFLANGFTGILNVLGHIVNLGATSIFHGWRDFKRSELMDYTDSNFATMQRLYRVQLMEVANVECDIPEGMNRSYPVTLTTELNFLKELDLLGRSDQMLKAADKILDSIRAQNSTFISTVKDTYREFANMSRINSLYGECEKCFTKGKVIATKPFVVVYKSSEEFTSVVKTLLKDGNTQLRAVATIFSRLEEIQEIVTEISHLVREEQIDRTQLDVLAKIARTWAEMFDKYAVVINDIYRIDHNVTLNVQSLREHLKI
jgi:hypothetical protein